MKSLGDPIYGEIEGFGTRFKLTVDERDWRNYMVRIEELEHNGRPLNLFLEKEIVDQVRNSLKHQADVFQFWVKRLNELEHREIGRSLDNDGPLNAQPAKAKEPYYRSSKDADYILEEAGLKGEKPTVFILSNPKDGRNSAYHYELEVAKQLSEKHNIPLDKITIYVEQGNKNYLPRTFTDYSLSLGQAGDEKSKRTPIQQNYRDRDGGELTRQEVEQVVERAQAPPAQSPGGQNYDFSKEPISR